MSDHDDGHDAEYGLVMPFVVCASKGGPYDDDAFTAGYEMGSLDGLIAQGPISLTTTIRTASVPQADLIAMHHGYIVTERRDEDDGEWSTVRIEPAANGRRP
jgi:hypothetical protein